MTDAVCAGIGSQALTAETHPGRIHLAVPGQVGNQPRHDFAVDGIDPTVVGLACNDLANSDVDTDGDKSLMREHEFRRIVATATAQESSSAPIGGDDRRILLSGTVVIR